MKTKYENTISFVRTSLNITKDAFEKLEPYTFRMFTMLQLDHKKVRSYK